jgi:glycosyltransferase involved in cell wall biosynthesis
MRTPRLIHYYARYLVHESGVTESIRHWADEAPTEYETQIWHARSSGRREESGPSRIRRRAIFHLGSGRSSWLPISMFWLLRRGDVVYLHEGWVLSNYVAAAAGWLRRCHTVVMPHGVYEPQLVAQLRDIGGLRKALERSLLRHIQTAHVFYPSEAQLIARFTSRELRFIAVANGCPAPSSVRRWTGTGDYFLWLGRFDPLHKGIDLLLRYWAALPGDRPPLRLVGPDFRNGKQEVLALIAELGLADSVSVEPAVHGEAKWELMRNCRAYLHPSRWESCSLALLDFLAIGAPCALSSSIHAAEPLGSDDAVLLVDFATAQPQPADALALLDRNALLGARARGWARENGAWSQVGKLYRTQLRASVTDAA